MKLEISQWDLLDETDTIRTLTKSKFLKRLHMTITLNDHPILSSECELGFLERSE
jgi:hypothetical protein